MLVVHVWWGSEEVTPGTTQQWTIIVTVSYHRLLAGCWHVESYMRCEIIKVIRLIHSVPFLN
jgi:hypothetical protein